MNQKNIWRHSAKLSFGKISLERGLGTFADLASFHKVEPIRQKPALGRFLWVGLFPFPSAQGQSLQNFLVEITQLFVS